MEKKYYYDYKIFSLAIIIPVIIFIAGATVITLYPEHRYSIEGYVIEKYVIKKEGNDYWENFIVVERSAENHQAISIERSLWETVEIGVTYVNAHFYCNDLGEFWEVVELS